MKILVGIISCVLMPLAVIVLAFKVAMAFVEDKVL